MRAMSCLLVVLCCAACPTPEGGGDAGTFNEVKAKRIDAEEVKAGSVNSDFVGADSASFTDVMAASINSSVVSSSELRISNGSYVRNVLGKPVGVVLSKEGTESRVRGYREASELCAEQFPVGEGEPVAHVCSATEIFIAAQIPEHSFPAEFDGAAYNGFSVAGPFPALSPGESPYVVDDCSSWRSRGPIVDGVGAYNFVVRLSDLNGTTQVASGIGGCATETKIACCR